MTESQSGLPVPTRTEAEWRIARALEIAKMHLHGSQEAFTRGGRFAASAGSIARAGLSQIISILDARDPAGTEKAKPLQNGER